MHCNETATNGIKIINAYTKMMMGLVAKKVIEMFLKP